ncbi:hypothetical protein CC2G_001542 [Coprinopsis cinerea AmutBmut pab1-1]|nr:hypothetical protein CC2G_001542 [Coprinopsis cinerea AmutBmut pab1-1]
MADRSPILGCDSASIGGGSSSNGMGPRDSSIGMGVTLLCTLFPANAVAVTSALYSWIRRARFDSTGRGSVQLLLGRPLDLSDRLSLRRQQLECGKQVPDSDCLTAKLCSCLAFVDHDHCPASALRRFLSFAEARPDGRPYLIVSLITSLLTYISSVYLPFSPQEANTSTPDFHFRLIIIAGALCT